MSDGSLSQDEIDALLQGSDTIELGSDFDTDAGGGEETLSDKEISALRTVLAGAVDSQSSNISMLAGQKITIKKPKVSIKTKDKLVGDLPNDVVEIRADFREGVSGEHSTLLDVKAAIKMASLMLGQDGVELNEMAFSTIGEAISNIISPAITAIGNKINATIVTTPPSVQKLPKTGISLPQGDNFVVVEYQMTVAGQSSRMVDIYSTSLANEIARRLSGADEGPDMKSEVTSDSGQMFQPDAFGTGADNDMGQPFDNIMGSGKGSNQPNVQSVQFPNLQQGANPQEQGNIGLLMDVYMEMTVELGRTKKLIKDILGIGEGTIIELDKLAGEPVDILVNHKLIAKGEVVVIDENFGVRVTEIVSPMERMGDLT
ncbi:MAG: flagellar motor switch phosphatase FliY [Spirochaetales bacterium]|nr:flagellar motor switch phosphatase FliY [Spirochaetales bacterium]